MIPYLGRHGEPIAPLRSTEHSGVDGNRDGQRSATERRTPARFTMRQIPISDTLASFTKAFRGLCMGSLTRAGLLLS